MNVSQQHPSYPFHLASAAGFHADIGCLKKDDRGGIRINFAMKKLLDWFEHMPISPTRVDTHGCISGVAMCFGLSLMQLQ